jgi:hypothetical protein
LPQIFETTENWSTVASDPPRKTTTAPVMFALRERLDGNRNTWWAYPTVGAALGVLPVGLITRIWSSNSAALVSPEAMLFFCMFAVFGAVFGAGFVFAYCRGSVSEG